MMESLSPHQTKIKNHFGNEQSLVLDGILDHDLFFASKYRILWILKEPYGEGGFSYADYMANDFVFGHAFPTSGPMWSKITYSNYGILKGITDWNDIPSLKEDIQVFNSLKSCALINLKKLPGTTMSNHTEIHNSYMACKELIHEQIELINPDIIICGGTFGILRADLNIDRNFETDVAFVQRHRLIINAYHPSYFFKKQRTYCDEIIGLWSRFNA